METQQTLPQQSENDLIAGGDTASTMPRESEGPLFDRYVVKIDLAVSAGAVPTSWPIGY